MKIKLSFVLGSALAAALGTANAGGPMTLNESQLDGVTAGRGFNSTTNVSKLVQIQELIQEQKLAVFAVFTQVEGFSAVAEAESDAEGPNADAQTFTFTEVYPAEAANNYVVASLSKSIALVDPREIPGRPAPTPTPTP